MVESRSADLQLTPDGKLKHLLTIEGLPPEVLLHILDTARSFVSVTEQEVKKVPLLRGKAIFNLFFEPSTRTRTTFEIAAKRLSADVVNLNIATSSQTKGETLLDTVANLTAMNADMFVVRHSQSGAAHLIARHVGPEHPCGQRRRRAPCPSDAGVARHVHDPPLQGQLQRAARCHRRRRAAFARGALRDPGVEHARRARRCASSVRARCCRGMCRTSACAYSTMCAPGWKVSTWSSCCGCRTSA